MPNSVLEKEFVVGWKISAVPTVVKVVALLTESPPAISTVPSCRRVAVCSERGLVMALGSKVKELSAGSKISADAREVVSLKPPAINTVPFESRVAVKSTRGSCMFPIEANV